MIEMRLADRREFLGMLPEWYKPANERCKYQKHGKGCAIYAHRPLSCRTWNCRWLVNKAGAGSRPDRCHFVIDITPDVIGTSQGEMPVVVVWCDPDYPDAHRDPALRDFLAECAEKNGEAALIRYSAKDAIGLFAPIFNADGKWREVRSGGADPNFKGLHERLEQQLVGAK
jgi:hypothetical protein